MKKEQVIISLTTWSKRIANLPVVLDSIYAQTYKPDKVVLNLAYNEEIPGEVEAYLKKHDVEVNFVEDTKVYKKIIPTLRKYPDACVINIDDDFIYPQGMIEDFMSVHQRYPNYPISGNRVSLQGRQCHCGCASLLKAEYFGDNLDKIDEEVMTKCGSSDIVFTYFATLNGHPYICSQNQYFLNMESHNSVSSYSENVVKEYGVEEAFEYLENRFGHLPDIISLYYPNTGNTVPENIVLRLIEEACQEKVDAAITQTENKIRSSRTYKLGSELLKPYRFLKKIKW